MSYELTESSQEHHKVGIVMISALQLRRQAQWH